MTGLAVLLAALGACCNALGARMQHGAVRAAMVGGTLGLRSQGRLLRSPVWLIGLAALGCGALLHAGGLGLAPLSVVQPVGVLALPLTVLINLRSRGIHVREMSPTVFAAVIAAMGGVSTFVLLAAGSATSTPVGTHQQMLASELVSMGVLVLGLAAAATRAKTRCVLFAAAGAVAYGYVSLMTRAVTQQLGATELLDINPLPLLGIAVAMVAGGWLLQHGYASGPPDLVVACLTVIDPLVAVGLGIGLLGEADRVHTMVATGEALCAVLACLGVFALARYHPDTTEHTDHADRTDQAEQAEVLEANQPLPATVTADIADLTGSRSTTSHDGSSS